MKKEVKKNRANKKGNTVTRHCACLVLSFFFFFFAFLVSCSGEYVGVPRAEVLSYQTSPTYGGLHALATGYAEQINSAVKADTLHPGMYAEYGITLALMGHGGPACRMLNAEVATFPQSRALVARIKQRLMPDLLADTFAVRRDTVNMAQLASWAYDSLKALQPLPYVAPVIDSTDTTWISMQTPIDSFEVPIRLTANQKREMLEQQQAQEVLRKKQIEDSIAAAKQAKIDARKQQKLDRDRAKKEKEKARAEEQKARKQQAEEARRKRDEERKAQKQETKK